MKLSSNAKAFVVAEVKAAFAEEYKKAEEVESAVTEKAVKKWKAFKKDLDVIAEKASRDAMALVRRHGLTPSDKDGMEIDVDFSKAGGYHTTLYCNLFMETADDFHNPEFKAARVVVNAIEDKIRKATSKALFEIEVHGKRDTLESIVAEVIKSIKEEK